MEIWHRSFNLKKKDNLDLLSEGEAVFAIFAKIGDVQTNCRYVNETENLRATVKNLFEDCKNPGLKKFMQGPWFVYVQYELMPGSSRETRIQRFAEWTSKYKPGVDDNGEYPGYYE